MTSIIEWIKSSVQHPSIPFFILFGAVLITLGLVNELPNPFGGTPFKIGGDLERIATMFAGLLSMCLAILLMYRPPPGWKTKTQPPEDIPESNQGLAQKQAGKGLPSDFDVSFLARRSSLSIMQKKLLALIENEKKLSFRAIKKELTVDNDAELYYRLEQLRLLGFIEKQRIEESAESVIVLYRLTTAYSERWNTLPADETHAIKIQQG